MHINNRLLKGTDLYQKIGYLDNRFPDVKIMGHTNQETTTGKNLCPTKEFISTSNARIVGAQGIINGIPVLANTKFPASFDIITLPSSDYRIQLILSSDSTQMQSGNDPVNIITRKSVECRNLTRYSVSVTTESSGYLYIRCVPYGFKIDNIQIEQGDATSYEEYTGGMPAPNPEFPMEITCRTINDLKLYGINSIKDYAYPKDGKWYIKKNIGKIILDASNDEDWRTSSKTEINRYYIREAFSTVYDSQSVDLKCNYFTCITAAQSNNNAIGMAKYNNNGLMLNFALSDTDFNTLEKFKTWLAINNITVYYVLAESYEEEITNKTTIALLEKTLSDYIKENQEEIIIN